MDYLITIFGDFKAQEKIDEITRSLQPLVDGENLTHNNNDYSLMIHFNANMDLETLSSQVLNLLYLKADMILISPSDVTSILANEDFMKSLMTNQLPNDTNNTPIEFVENISLGLERLREEIMKLEEGDQDDDMLLDQLIKGKTKQKTTQPTLDDLLDKICRLGMDSLNNKEKQLLNKYSK